MDNTAVERNGKFQHLVDHLLDLYDEIKGSAYRKKMIQLINESKAACNQDVENTNDPWPGACNTMLPFTAITNDNLAPRLASGLMGKWPYVRFELPNDQPKDEQTEITESWFNQELQDIVNIEQVGISVIERLLEEGTVYALPKYCLEEITRRDFQFDPQSGNPIMEDGVPVMTDKKESIFEGGRVELLPFTDVFIPDNVDDDEWDAEPVIRHIYPTYADLQREKKYSGYFTENVGDWLLKDEGERELREDEQSIDQKRDNIKVTGKETIKCIECSISYIYQEEDQEKEDIKDWEEERLLVTIALESKTILRLRLLRDINWENRHPVRRVTLFRKMGESYGRPMYAKLKSIQEGANKTFRTAINTAEITMIPWFLYTSKLGLKGDVKKLIPGQGVQVDDTKEILFPRFSVNPSQLFSYLDIWGSFWERVASIGDLQTGRTDDSRSTATEVLAVIQEGNIKHNYQSRPVRSQFIDVLRTLYDLYYQHLPMNKTFLHNGQQVPIPRAALKRKAAFRLTASTEMSNKLIERKEKEDLWRAHLEDPNGVINPVWAAENLVRSYGITDISEAINPQIAKIAKAIQEVPQAAELFDQAFQQALQMAEQMEQQGKAQGSAIAQKAMGG